MELSPGEPVTRLDELLADLATVGLGDAERAELAALLGTADAPQAWEVEAAAAAATLAWIRIEPLPDPVRARLERRGELWAAARRRQSTN